MKQFKFSLEAVMTLRKMEQEKELEAYAARVNECVQLRAHILSAQRRHNELSELIKKDRELAVSPALQEAYGQGLILARKEEQTLKVALSDAEQRKEEQLALFLQAKQKVDVLVNLKEQKGEAYRLDTLRAEEKEIEDYVIARQRRQSLTV